ncbi:MAG: hypothetical protein JRC77_00910 [Deltaproteobacteria bacterium]|nr:hypothetical protein [Deltaproteobacteria bacterium]
MKTWKNLRVRTLIEENQSHTALRECARLLEHGEIKSNISHRVSVQDLIDAYQQDSTHGEGRSANADGFEELLQALHGTDQTYLRLVTLKTESEDTVVFTDPNLNQVVGALRVMRTRVKPEKKSTLSKDQQFFQAMGEEVGPQVCREPGCARLRVSGSVRCRNHLFEMVKGRAFKAEAKPLKLKLAGSKDNTPKEKAANASSASSQLTQNASETHSRRASARPQ